MRCLVYILFKEFGESIKDIINEDIDDGYVRYHAIHVLLLCVQNKRCRLEDRVHGEKSNPT
ncbi:hypothetical protein HanIR_Chr09g0434231 [Helianthus annuus]|nr:hypothetical protein HanIR_Chr09g0434231 [Helianthus annuus]